MCGSWRGENGRVGETQCDMVRTRAASIGFESNRARVSGTLAQGQRARLGCRALRAKGNFEGPSRKCQIRACVS